MKIAYPHRLRRQNLPSKKGHFNGKISIKLAKKKDKCPSCGYCQHCGRSDMWQSPYRVPPYPYGPVWISGGTSTITTEGSITSDSVTVNPDGITGTGATINWLS